MVTLVVEQASIERRNLCHLKLAPSLLLSKTLVNSLLLDKTKPNRQLGGLPKTPGAARKELSEGMGDHCVVLARLLTKTRLWVSRALGFAAHSSAVTLSSETNITS